MVEDLEKDIAEVSQASIALTKMPYPPVVERKKWELPNDQQNSADNSPDRNDSPDHTETPSKSSKPSN